MPLGSAYGLVALVLPPLSPLISRTSSLVKLEIVNGLCDVRTIWQLSASATGTGKTKTCIALIYRLLKVKRFQRVLFLVDRSALGEQAANAFKETRMERLQTFADVFGLKELSDVAPDDDTSVHVATVQGMMKRVLFPSELALPPTVDQYDCIVVDECHRGYTLAQARQDFETKVGMPPAEFANKLKAMPVADVASWFISNPQLGEILDRKSPAGGRRQLLLSDHEDSFKRVERGYGKAAKPEDYINEFKAFIQSHSNDLPALRVVLTRPRDLTRQQLKELILALDQAGYTETRLATAWREMSNQDIAARIIGYIRQAALGDALLPYAERVDHALQTLLAHPPHGQAWTTPQREWLKRIAAQTKANLLVDRAALDDPDLLFRREGGGYTRLDKLFNGQLQPVLDAFNDALWQPPARSA